VLDALLSTSEGDDAAIGHLYMLARTFRQMLVILERTFATHALSGRRCGRAFGYLPLPLKM